MYEEDLVFDMLTKRQLVIFILGVVASVVTYFNSASSEYALAAPLIWVVITLALVFRFRPHPVADPEEYLKQHPEKRQRFIEKLKRKEKELLARNARLKNPEPIAERAVENIRALILRLEGFDSTAPKQ